MSRITLNRTPYFDDFQSSKNFMRILFRPARPVQTRELNQIQSILQNQIEQFANHIFKNGSRVSNAQASLTSKSYVRLDDLPVDGDGGLDLGTDPVDLDAFTEGLLVTGQTTGINARLVKTVNAITDDPPTIYVVYTSTAIDGETTTFLPGETLRIYDTNNVHVYSVKVKCPGCPGGDDTDTISPIGEGQIFSIREGVWYYEGMFVENAEQDIIVSKYGEFNELKIGFDFVQTIVTSDDDLSLLDNALGYPNHTAPGADRYKVTLTLTTRTLEDDDGDNFILLAKMVDNQYLYLKTDSEYSEILDYLAKRQYETNGNYTVSPFPLRFIEDKADSASDPLGYDVDGDDDYVRSVVGPGISYVKGYRYENTIDLFIKTYKARDTKRITQYPKRFEDKTYILLKPFKGKSAYPNLMTDPNSIDGTVVEIYDENFDTDGDPQGNLIGTCKVWDVQYVSGDINVLDVTNIAGTNDDDVAIFKYYIYDIQMVGTYTLDTAKGFKDSGSTKGFLAKNAEADNALVVYNPGNTELLWKINRTDIKTLHNDDEPPTGSLAITLRKKLTGVVNSSGNVTFTTGLNEYFLSYNPLTTVGFFTPSGAGAGEYYTIDFQGGSATFTSNTTSATVALGTSQDFGGGSIFTAGGTVTVIHNVIRTNATEDTLLSNTVTIDNLTQTQSATYNTGVNHAYEIVSVTSYHPTDGGVDPVDVTDYFTLNENVTDYGYNESTVTAASDVPTDTELRWSIVVRYWDHNRSSQMGFLTVDSYEDAIAAGDMEYADQPTWEADNEIQYPLFQSFDFRADEVDGTYDYNIVPAVRTTALFDLEYYLSRIDLLQVDKDDNVYVKKGLPSESPVPPKPDANAMALYEIHFKPYTYTLNDIRKKFIENKRYTMRDIGRLESRIKNLEYYTTLTLLEQSAEMFNVKDNAGLDRFKNGFLVDNFADYQAADLASPEWGAAVDKNRNELRPAYTSRSNRLELTDSGDALLRGKMAMIDYDEVVLDEQPFATKHISINPYFQFKREGEMILSPNNDVWADVERQPELVVEVDTGSEDLIELLDQQDRCPTPTPGSIEDLLARFGPRRACENNSLLGTQWGAWSEINRSVVTEVVGQRERTVTVKVPGTNQVESRDAIDVFTATTTTRDQERTGTVTTIESRTDAYNLGDRVTDVRMIPYMRPTRIEFFCTKMLPNTKVYAFFDGVPVSEYCRPMSGGPNGTQLITDANGQLAGLFDCPADTFFTGDRELYITNDSTLSGDADLETTVAKAQFFSGGLDVTKQSTTLNVLTPTLVTEEITETRTTTTVENNRFTPGFVRCWQTRRGCSGDPVAQSFTLEQDHFITGINLYFQAMDTTAGQNEIWFEIRNMVNGYPGEQVLANKRHLTSEIPVSDDSTVPFKVEFDSPVFLQGETDYCFVVGGWSPNSRIWLSKLGQEVVNIPGKIVESQPTLGSSFRSQNNETWNAEQFEDIKYSLLGCQFKSRTMSLTFQHVPEKVTLGTNPFEAESGSNRIRVNIPDHGFVAGDKLTLNALENNTVTLTVSSGVLNVGQTVTTTGGFSGKVKTITENGNNFDVTFEDVTGTYDAATDTWSAASLQWTVHDNYQIGRIGYTNTAVVSATGGVTYNAATGSFVTDYPEEVNGIPYSELNKQHDITEVDTVNSVIITTVTNADTSGRFGGDVSIEAEINQKYEIFNVSGAYLPYSAIETWTYQGYGHYPVQPADEDKAIDASQNYATMPTRNFVVAEDNHLGEPHKVVSTENSSGGTRMITITADFEAPSEWVSPIVNTDTFSIITVSNQIQYTNATLFEVEPNATGRYVPESAITGGTEPYKYVTKTVNLATPATDMVIVFDMYKDVYSDYDIWIKRIAPYESTTIPNKRWMRVSGLDKTVNSADLTTPVEVSITLSDYSVDVYTTDYDYTTVAWDALDDTEFSSFKVKLVGRAKNPAKPPLFQNLRIIAVT